MNRRGKVMTNLEVVKYWYTGRPAQGSHLRSDGVRLFSYNMVIGVCIHKEEYSEGFYRDTSWIRNTPHL